MLFITYNFFDKGVFNNFDFNYYLTIIGFVIGVIGLILTIKKKKQDDFVVLTTRARILLSHNSITAQPNLKVLYNGQEVGSIHEYIIYLFNEGDSSYDINEFIEPIIITLNKDFEFFNLSYESQSDLIYSSNNFFKPGIEFLNDSAGNPVIKINEGLIEPQDLIAIRLLYDVKKVEYEKFAGFSVKFKVRGRPEVNSLVRGGDYGVHFMAESRYYNVVMISPMFIIFFGALGLATLKLVCRIPNLSAFADTLGKKVNSLHIDLEFVYTFLFFIPFVIIAIYSFKRFRQLFRPYIYLIDDITKGNRPSWDAEKKTGSASGMNFYY